MRGHTSVRLVGGPQAGSSVLRPGLHAGAHGCLRSCKVTLAPASQALLVSHHLCCLLPPSRWIVFAVLSGGFWAFTAVVWLFRRILLSRYQYRLWRLVRTFVVLGVIAFLVGGAAGDGTGRQPGSGN